MDCNGPTVDGLIDATITRNIAQVEILIQNGVDPCQPTPDGTTPIHKAAVIEPPFGSSIISIMLSYGADPNVKTVNGLSPLHVAAMWGRVATINVLLDNGADVALKDHDDMSPLDYAEQADECRDESIDALTKYRATRDENDSGCEMNGNYHSKKQNCMYNGYYMNGANSWNRNYYYTGQFDGNYYWYNQNGGNANYMCNGYQPYGSNYINNGNWTFDNRNLPCGDVNNRNHYSNIENQNNDKSLISPIKDGKSCKGPNRKDSFEKENLPVENTFTDISDLSDTDNEENASDESSSESFWSVSSVPYSKDSTMVRSIVRKLEKELTIAETESSNSNCVQEAEFSNSNFVKEAESSLVINHDDVAVIICGIQESYRWKINQFHQLCDIAQRLLTAVHILDIPVLTTEDPTYDYGPTVREIDISQSWVFKKTSFSGATDEVKDCLTNLKDNKKLSEVILFGLEAHISVQLTALDLISEGYNVHIVRDATFSRLHDDRMFAFERIRQSGGHIDTFESIFCKILKNHEHPKYDQIKELFTDFY